MENSLTLQNLCEKNEIFCKLSGEFSFNEEFNTVIPQVPFFNDYQCSEIIDEENFIIETVFASKNVDSIVSYSNSATEKTIQRRKISISSTDDSQIFADFKVN